jgi:hypothetical protein
LIPFGDSSARTVRNMIPVFGQSADRPAGAMRAHATRVASGEGVVGYACSPLPTTSAINSRMGYAWHRVDSANCTGSV